MRRGGVSVCQQQSISLIFRRPPTAAGSLGPHQLVHFVMAFFFVQLSSCPRDCFIFVKLSHKNDVSCLVLGV